MKEHKAHFCKCGKLGNNITAVFNIYTHRCNECYEKYLEELNVKISEGKYTGVNKQCKTKN